MLSRLSRERSGTLHAIGMADVLGLIEEDYLFGDIGGVIANALKCFGDENELNQASSLCRVSHDPIREKSVVLPVNLVDSFVTHGDAGSTGSVLIDQATHRIPYLSKHKRTHFLDPAGITEDRKSVV